MRAARLVWAHQTFQVSRVNCERRGRGSGAALGGGTVAAELCAGVCALVRALQASRSALCVWEQRAQLYLSGRPALGVQLCQERVAAGQRRVGLGRLPHYQGLHGVCCPVLFVSACSVHCQVSHGLDESSWELELAGAASQASKGVGGSAPANGGSGLSVRSTTRGAWPGAAIAELGKCDSSGAAGPQAGAHRELGSGGGDMAMPLALGGPAACGQRSHAPPRIAGLRRASALRPAAAPAGLPAIPSRSPLSLIRAAAADGSSGKHSLGQAAGTLLSPSCMQCCMDGRVLTPAARARRQGRQRGPWGHAGRAQLQVGRGHEDPGHQRGSRRGPVVHSPAVGRHGSGTPLPHCCMQAQSGPCMDTLDWTDKYAAAQLKIAFL